MREVSLLRLYLLRALARTMMVVLGEISSLALV